MNKAVAILFAPMGVCLAGIGYGLWPYVAAEEEAAPPKPAAAAIEARSLDPDVGNAPPRNPFLNEAQLATLAMAKAEFREAEPAATTAQAEAKPAGTATAKAAEPKLIAKLGAVVLGQGRRSAIINGRVYKVGETVKGLGRDDWQLATVAPESAILKHETDAKILTLRFGERPRKADRAGAAPALAGLVPTPAPAADSPLSALGIGPILPRSAPEQLGVDSGGDLARAYGSLLKLAIEGATRPGSNPVGSPPANP